MSRVKFFLLAVTLLLFLFGIKSNLIRPQDSKQGRDVSLTGILNSATTTTPNSHGQNDQQPAVKGQPSINITLPIYSQLYNRSVKRDGTIPALLDSDSMPCNDALCTQYLNKVDLAMFVHCSRHLQKKRYQSSVTDNGTCRFMDGTSRRKVALASFPGSGNTWVRGLLEKATGVCTGSVYCDSSLRVSGFNGEGVSSSAALAVKTHESPKTFDAAIHLVRCPGDAIVSEWNRKRGPSANGGQHTARASPQDFGENEEWDSFVREWGRRWGQSVLRVASYQQQLNPLLRVFYEDLKTNTSHEVTRMLEFLKVPHLTPHLQQQSDSSEKFHRQAGKEEIMNHFTQQQREALAAVLTHVIAECTMKGYEDSKEYVKNYLLTCI